MLVVAPVAAVNAQSIVTGRVFDTAKRPVVDAQVVVVGLDVRLRTDSGGRFRFGHVPIGPRRVAVRHIGFAPESVDVLVTKADSVQVSITLVEHPLALPPITVERTSERTVPYHLRDFERRRTSGVGHFLTADDLQTERSKPLGDVVVRLPGAHVVRSMASACLTTMRGAQSFQNGATGRCGGRSVGGLNCPVAVFLDGFPVYTGHSEEIFNLNTLHADEVAGVEFYSGPSTLPREFSAPRGTCGAVVIWTKR